MEAIVSLIANIQDEEDRKKIKEIIDQHIGDVYIKKCKVDKYLAKEIEIHTVSGDVQIFAYAYKGHKVYKFSTLSQKWIPCNDKIFERIINETETFPDKILDILKSGNVNENEKAFLLSVMLGKDVKE